MNYQTSLWCVAAVPNLSCCLSRQLGASIPYTANLFPSGSRV